MKADGAIGRVRGVKCRKGVNLSLTQRHRVRLVYPIAYEKWIVRLSGTDESVLGRRKSPKRGAVELVFEELVSIPHLLAHPNFSIELLLIQEEEVRWQGAVRRGRRKGWFTHERRLLQVMGERLLETPADALALIPTTLTVPFTTTDLARAIGRPRWLAQKIVYCLRHMGGVAVVGRRGRSPLYSRQI